MIQIRKGQVVRFHTPNHDEDPEQLYVVLEFFEDGERSRALITPANSDLFIPGTLKVYSKDLEVDEGQTFELDYYLKYER